MNKLVINAYSDTNGGSPFENFVLQLNPVSISVTKSTDNLPSSTDADGSTTSSSAATFQPAKITFKFTIDNTGVVNLDSTNCLQDKFTQLNATLSSTGNLNLRAEDGEQYNFRKSIANKQVHFRKGPYRFSYLV